MAPKVSIPDGWRDYTKIGKPIEGTRFIAFKVPFKESFNKKLPEQEKFYLADLFQEVQDLGLIIDLTNTDKYYSSQVVIDKGIKYAKIKCRGQTIPNDEAIQKFFDTVEEFSNDDSSVGKLIGVHCTHGANRTGYLVCRYMIEKLNIPLDVAISSFVEARGHKIDREEYLKDLQNLEEKLEQEREHLFK